MTTPRKSKAVLVIEKGWQDKYTHRIADFRKTARLKDTGGVIRGIGSYALYGIKHREGQMVVLASEPTSADFNQYVTAHAKADACARYDHVIEYRDVGPVNKPKVTMLIWELAQ